MHFPLQNEIQIFKGYLKKKKKKTKARIPFLAGWRIGLLLLAVDNTLSHTSELSPPLLSGVIRFDSLTHFFSF